MLEAAEQIQTEPKGRQPRFTVDGDEALEAHLETVCERVLEGVRRIVPAPQLHGLLLGGGYGRGEGGVLRTPEGDRPYNDLEYYIFVRGEARLAERRYRAALQALGHELEPVAGIEVEFKVISRAMLQRSDVTMFFHDLYAGHRRIAGGDDLLEGCEHLADATAIPLHEATRLMMNRCSGLLFAAERLQRDEFTAEDADFVGRNVAKAQLGIGDSILVAHGLYHSSARVRSERLWKLTGPDQLSDFATIGQLHREGVAFKLQPVRSGKVRTALKSRHTAVSMVARDVFLWLESLRLGVHFPSPLSYAASPCNKRPETPGWRNTLVNLRWQGLTAMRRAPRRHPRQRLFHALALLLWEREAFANPKISGRLASELLKPVTNLASAVTAYEPLWRRFQ